MEVDVCVALMSRRTKEEGGRGGLTEFQVLDDDSLVDRGTDTEDSAGEPEEAAGEINSPAPVELSTQGAAGPGELERNKAMTTGSLVERGGGRFGAQATLPIFGEDLAQSVSELLPEILPFSQFDGVIPVSSAHCVITQRRDERTTVMSGIYRPQIELEPVNNIIRNVGSNSAIKDDCDDENRAICFSKNDSDTFNDTLETRGGDTDRLLDRSWDKEHTRNCGGVNLDCCPVSTIVNNQVTGFEIDCNFVSSNVINLCKGEMNSEMGSISEETSILSKTSGDNLDIEVQCSNDLGPEAGTVPDLTLEKETPGVETTCDRVENVCIPRGCAEISPRLDMNTEHMCSPDRNFQSACSQATDAEKSFSLDNRNIENACSPDRQDVASTCSCDKNGETAFSPDKNSESACGSDRGSQLALAPFPLAAGVEGRPESLSPTVNLDFGAVYWTKDKSKSERDEDTAGNNVVLPPTKKVLHVTFADEEGLVSGCMEPAIPWMEAWLCSTSELVFAYKAACESVGVKPLKKLLVQLEGVKRFDVRSDLLSLKGESFDWKHCETLEAIFKRVQFNTINVEEMRLEDEVAVTMFDLLQYYQSCQRLIMNRSTNLGTRGWQAWTRLMKQSTGLQHLEARGLSIPDHTLPVIGKYLRTGSMLRTLQLENSIRSGRHLNLLAAAMKTSQSVQELYLGDNQLLPADGLQLGTMLKGNSSLRLLDVRNNHLQDTGMGHICDGMADQVNVNGLNTLVIWNNQISHQSMPALSRALAATKSLETLNIGHNNITNDGVHRLKDGLMQNKTLLRIGLQATKLSCEGAVALAEFVAESLKLVRLDLRENSIRTGGLMALSLSLKVNQTVTCVDLDKEPKKESGMKDYAEQQKRLLSDIVSFATRNSLLAIASNDQREKGHDLESPSDMDDVTSSGKNDAGDDDESTEASAPSTRAASLSLTLLSIPTRCETLESPSYFPDHLSLLSPPTDWDDKKAGTTTSASPNPPIVGERPDLPVPITTLSLTPPVNVVSVIPENVTAGDAPNLTTSKVALQDNSGASAESSKTSVNTVVPKPPIAEKPTAPPGKKLVRTTKRKFTISKAVLPSALSPKAVVTSTAVLFTARPTSVSDDGQLDSESHVCIVGTSLPDAGSNAGDVSKKNRTELDLHPLVKQFSVTKMLTDASDVVGPTSGSKVATDATVCAAGSDSSVVGASAGGSKETVVVETSRSAAAKETIVVETSRSEETVVVETSRSVAAEETVVAETSRSAVAQETVVMEMSQSTAAIGMVVIETSRSVAAETVPVMSCQRDVSVPKNSDVPFASPLSALASCPLVSELTLAQTASVSAATEGRLDLNIPERDLSFINPTVGVDPSTTNAVGNENRLPTLNDVLRVTDSTRNTYPAERDQSLTDMNVVGRDHSVINAGIDCSSTCTHLETGLSAKVFECSLLPSVACAKEETKPLPVISVANKSPESSGTSSSDPNPIAKGIPGIAFCTQVNYNAEDERTDNDNRSVASSCSQESITSVGSTNIKFERWSTQTKDESSNFLIQMSHFDDGSDDAFKAPGNNGQDCIDFSLGLDDDFRKSNSVSVSSSDGTFVSDSDEFLTATEESESENSDLESTRWKTGVVEKSGDDDRLIDTLAADGDSRLVFDGRDRLLEVVSTAVSSLVSDTKLVYSVNNLKHDVLDSVNANASSTAEH